MGGGDLNSKKSWHPNTVKNQERVWKAEQAAAEEKKRIAELQKERAEERERAELNALANRTAATKLSKSHQDDDSRLNWMYDKPDKKVQAEEYLLGRSVDSTFDGPSANEKDAIPAVSSRVAGASMLSGAGDMQVDLVRKMREDPLLLVRERERAARAALLNNPIHRKKIADLLRQEQEKKKENKSKKTKGKDKNIDNELAAKLSSLGGENNIDLAALLASDDSSNSSDTSTSCDEKIKKKKKKKVKEKKSKSKKPKKSKKKSKKKESKKKVSDDSDSSEDESKKNRKNKKVRDSKELKRRISPCHETSTDEHKRQKLAVEHKHAERSRQTSRSRDKEQRAYNRAGNDIKHKRNENRDRINLDNRDDKYRNRSRSDHHRETERQPQSNRRSRSRERQNRVPSKSSMTDSERAAKLAEMVRAGAEHEVRRGQRVAAQRVADDLEPRTSVRPAHAHAHSLPNSLESRIQSNRHYIQRNKGHMNEHFARR